MAGANDSGKKALRAKLQAKDFQIFDNLETDDLAVGLFADYRTELFLASTRIALQVKTDEVLVHSLIDNVAYCTVRLYDVMNNDALPEDVRENEILRWNLTLHLIGLMLVDGWNPNSVVVYLPTWKLDKYSLQIDEAIKILLREWNFNVWCPPLDVTLDSDSNPESIVDLDKAVGFIEEYLTSEATVEELTSKYGGYGLAGGGDGSE